ncbi:alpha/beta hydrolase [Fructobacillus evanidus]|uniref:Alpha/beta hydrolase fold (MenH) n=1 Tax=Fructobacillus evanidus TaxID=3064281 RepID=A0ABN9YXQ8_9LACO|nr:2-succinyl-6-hydroxy-2 [Fructobacillus sp. LMG 32999]CAK1241764.1 2-succinyl-6-hydroxy-2 [Fructobacillus sp. LMG 32999]CAK1248565.1 2-succinyl-6-hydroxy-2 [Fructobacillus sp. LMG 32999]CAK1248603.1 2-succinyl-6-hydroxy-2 [Fructobacillus sp. LMG 32999]CAK1250226.1 2-succinyl-6-hydroxy-2 [Fructobacillus sp. LMG 32999]
MKTSNLVDYESFGDGMPIVFLHGMALSKESNIFFFEPFLQFSNWQRIYLDLPGMGHSAPIDKANSDTVLDTLVKSIKEIIGNQKFVLYGHSYGGYMAQALAEIFSNQIIGLFLTAPVVTAHKSKRLLAKHQNIFIEPVKVDKNADYYNDFLSMNSRINQENWENIKN